MAKNSLKQVQTQQQKLSQQNIKLFKMMELNLLQFDEKIKEELDMNPALEDIDNSASSENIVSFDREFSPQTKSIDSLSLEGNYSNTPGSRESADHYGQSHSDIDDSEWYIPAEDNETLLANLNNQLTYLNLSSDQMIIGEFIIGSLDDDGYLRRSMESIMDDLSFRQNFYTSKEAVAEVLEFVQDLDPPGIAARNLQECLSIQLRKKKYTVLVDHALTIVNDYFEDYTKKNYDRIFKKLKLTEIEFQAVKTIIQNLNPLPGQDKDNTLGKFIIPDFFVYRNEKKLELELHSYNKPNLVINKEFVNMLKKIKAEKKKSKAEQDAQDYVADKINKANQFLSLIKERQETMVIIMETILTKQREFFLTGEESNLKPMTLKNIADVVFFDVSTISRVTSTKYVQTEFGIFSLKKLFTEGIMNAGGEEVSNRKIMKTIEDLIEDENKSNPFSDDDITIELEKMGYKIARRTVAKYRENLKIPPKHARKLNS
jgi:RNA polymerase sigma-54 factor